MNAITPIAPAPVVAKTSAALAVALENEMLRLAQEPGWRSAPTRQSDAVIEEARALLANAGAITRPASADHIARWIEPLNVACRNPQSADDIDGWAEAVAFACQRIPASAFNPDNLRKLMAASQFFPSAADVLAIVQPEADRVHRKLAAARSIAQPPPEPAPAPAPADPARMLAMAAALKAEAIANDAEARRQGRGSTPAKPVSEGALLATYTALAAAGNKAAAHRKAMIEKRLINQGIAV